MKKMITVIMIGVMMLTTSMSLAADTAEKRGGVMGFIAGCCFGLRTGGDYNSGKEVHWREWVMLIPVANIVFCIWNGIEGANGVTRTQYAEQYGSIYY